MAKKEDFDVVIIGSGVSGLVCGCYLQKAGLKVAILEAREEAGGGRMAHEMMRPGLSGSVLYLGGYGLYHAASAQSGAGQIWLSGNRDGFRLGLWICLSGWDLFGWSLLGSYKTAEKVRRFSEKDAKKMLEIAEFLREPYDDKTPRARQTYGVIFP